MCIWDSIPTTLFKKVKPLINTPVLNITNPSIELGYISLAFKLEEIKPPVKKNHHLAQLV